MVVIIGAGLSGLLIASELKKAGLAVKVIEARDRIGGRIFTLQSKGETPVELGATWFGAQHSNLVALLERLKIPSYEQYMKGSVFYEPHASAPAQAVDIPMGAPSFRIAGGTSQIIQALSEKLTEEELVLNQPVREITFADNLVEVKTDTLVIEADRVISTLPPGLLVKTIRFEPTLPQGLFEIAASTHTWMHDAIKTALVYERPFWREQNLSGAVFSNVGPVNEFYDHTDFTISKFALCGFVNAEFATLSRSERKEKVVTQLSRMFGEIAKTYIGYEELLWSHEKYTSASSEADLYPHQNNGHRIYEKTWYDGRLIVTGSETSSQFGGYMDGAVHAAMKTVDRVVSLIKG